MTTAKEYQASFGKRKPNLQEVEELYRLRERDVQAIAAKPVITVADIQTLEWGGRFHIANEYLHKCDKEARGALLHDQHHAVRAAATLVEEAEIYRLRLNRVQALAAKPVVTLSDIQALDWGGRFQIANEYFDKCDEQARDALLHDPHNGVRSAATLFKPRERAAPAPAAVAPAPAPANASEIATAIMNGKDRIKTLHGEKSAAGVEAMILSSHPREALQRAESFISGFEGDELQDGVNEVLTLLRDALKPLQ